MSSINLDGYTYKEYKIWDDNIEVELDDGMVNPIRIPSCGILTFWDYALMRLYKRLLFYFNCGTIYR